MALNFPDNPGIGSVFVDTNSGFSFKWDGTVWNGFAGSSASEISNLDNIAGSFNGSTTTFALAKDSASVSPVSAVQLRVVLGGVTQTAGTDYTISGSNITFTTAPLAGLTCTITQLGVALSLADPANGSVTPAKLSTGGPKWNSSGDFYISGIATANNGLVVGVGLTLADDVKINLGDNDDLQIVHDGSNSLIDGAGTGGVHLKSNTEIKFLKRTGSENILVGTADGSVAAFYDNTKRLETTTGGALVYGTVGAAQTALVVEGDIKATGVVTAVSFNGEVAGAAATTNSTGLHVVGVATVLNVNSTNVTAGVVTATTFSGALSGNATSATTATTATNVTVADESSDTSCNVLFTTAATGDLAPKSGTNLTFNSSSGALTATSFVGSLTGDATGLSGTPNIDCGTGSFTGDVDIADKIVHTGDTNTAIRFPATDTVTVETAGSEAIRVDSSARLLVGTSSGNDSGAQSNLVIESNSSGGTSYGGLMLRRGSTSISSGTSLGRMFFADQNGKVGARISGLGDGTWATNDYPGVITFDTTADGASSLTERLRIDSTGRLLINHTTARTNFFQSTGLNALINVEGTNNATRATSFVYNSNDAGQHLFVIGKSRGTSVGSNTIVQDDDNLGGISFHGADGSKLVEGARISGVVDGTPGSSDMPGRLVFSTTADGAAATTEAMRIDSKQRVTVKAGAIAEIGPLNSASTVTPDFATHCNFTLTLGTNVTLANPDNLTQGQSGSNFLLRDGTGSRTITFGSQYYFAGGTAPTLSTAASSVDRLDYIVRTSSSIHCVVTLAYS